VLEARSTPFPAARATTAAVARILDGLAQEQARRPRRDRPFVTLSWAQSLDGCIARAPGVPTALSGEGTRGMTHALRAAHDAILIGVGTLLADDPALTVRFWDGESPAPVVLDSRLRTPSSARLLAAVRARPVTFACTTAGDVGRQQQLEACGAKVLRLPACQSQWVDLPALLAELGAAGVQRLMVEGGAKVLTSFLRSGLADYAVVTIAPRLLGGLPAVTRVAGELQQLTDAAYERLGPDVVMAGPLGGRA
jgi:3,4-dihydroxy 2-butanone 4-phosphate synthase/GTP cyclohydrolase II